MGKLLTVSGVIAGKLTRLAVQVRDALGTHTEKMRTSGLISTITNWPYFGDHPLARFRRSPGGSISAIIQWPHFGDHAVAL
jgi:hypothetical protein